MDEKQVGRFHSKETFGTVDGPGIRYVAFLQGCPLRCLYCHNADTWDVDDVAYSMTVDEFVADVVSYKSFIRSGGVTFSGGEPLIQADFVRDSIVKLKKKGISSAIDTSGVFPFEKGKAALLEADLILLDIKAADTLLAKRLTGAGNEQPLKVLDFLEEHGKTVWIRHVLLPDYTLKDDELYKLANLLKGYKCIELVDLLPFHKLGEFKWKELGLEYKLDDVKAPSKEEIQHAKEILEEVGLPVRA